jgi:hypothetical protein
MPNKNQMNYQQARRIRNTGFTKILADQLILNRKEGIFKNIGRTISLSSQARMKGFKEKFDPLNIAKFMTGGSSLGPALLGRMLGRSTKDIEYFSGRARPISTATRIGKTPGEGEGADLDGINSMLRKIFSYMKDTQKEEKKRRELENNFKEELANEEERRHKEFLAAINRLMRNGQQVQTAAPLQQQPSMLDYLLEGLALSRALLPVLANVVRFFAFTPLGAAILAATTLAALLASDKNPEQTTKAMIAAGNPDAAMAEAITEVVSNTDAVERRKLNILADRPSSEKASIFKPWENKEYEDKYLKKIGWDDKTGTTAEERAKGFIGIDEDGKLIREKPKAVPIPKPAPNTEKTGSVDTAVPSQPVASAPKSESMPQEPVSSKVATASTTVKNLMEDQEFASLGPINTTSTNTVQKPDTVERTAIPNVRNPDATYQRLILESTRLV